MTGPVLPRLARAQLALPDVGPGGYGTPWRFVAGMSVDETWSDNINLAPSGQARSDFVTSLTPTFQASRSGPRLTLHLDYAPSYLVYAKGTNGSTLRNSLDAQMNATIVQNLLFFDAAAFISQQNISPYGTQAYDQTNGSANRVESRTYTLGPTLRSRLQQDITYEVGAHYSFSNSDSSAYAANHTTQYYGQVQTSTSFRDVGIGVSGSRTEYSYNTTNSIITEQGSATLTYVLSPTIHLRATGGYDRDVYPSTGQPELSGASYSGGFDWQPTHHTALNATVGHRYFGPTANIRLVETRPRWALTVGYLRDQSTSAAGGFTPTIDPNYAILDQYFRGTITDPVARAQAVTQALSQAGLSTSQYATSSFFTNQLYVQKNLFASLALIGLSNTVTIEASRNEAQGLSNLTVGFDVFNQSNRFRTTSYSSTWSHRLGPHTVVNATASRSSSSALEGTGDSHQRQFVLSASRTISRYVSASVLYRNTAQKGSGTVANNFYGGNYNENAVVGSLRVNF